LGTAKITCMHIPEYLDTVTFHCQQAVEKYLKAYLIFQSTPYRFSHDLIYLLDLITQKDSDFEGYYDIVSESLHNTNRNTLNRPESLKQFQKFRANDFTICFAN
jgi:hypothetical protein